MWRESVKRSGGDLFQSFLRLIANTQGLSDSWKFHCLMYISKSFKNSYSVTAQTQTEERGLKKTHSIDTILIFNCVLKGGFFIPLIQYTDQDFNFYKLQHLVWPHFSSSQQDPPKLFHQKFIWTAGIIWILAWEKTNMLIIIYFNVDILGYTMCITHQ